MTIIAIYVHTSVREYLNGMRFYKSRENSGMKDARETNNSDRKRRIRFVNFRVAKWIAQPCSFGSRDRPRRPHRAFTTLMSRTRNFSVDDANEARAATTRPMYLHLSERRGLMEKRFRSSTARDN